jgi:hypothetical protein
MSWCLKDFRQPIVALLPLQYFFFVYLFVCVSAFILFCIDRRGDPRVWFGVLNAHGALDLFY